MMSREIEYNLLIEELSQKTSVIEMKEKQLEILKRERNVLIANRDAKRKPISVLKNEVSDII